MSEHALDLDAIEERWYLTPDGLREMPLAQRPKMVKDIHALLARVRALSGSANSTATATECGAAFDSECCHDRLRDRLAGLAARYNWKMTGDGGRAVSTVHYVAADAILAAASTPEHAEDVSRFLELVGETYDLQPWQAEMARAALSGEPLPFVHRPRSSGKRVALIGMGAAMEAALEKWDVVGDPNEAREIRRRARELAAESSRPPESREAGSIAGETETT